MSVNGILEKLSKLKLLFWLLSFFYECLICTFFRLISWQQVAATCLFLDKCDCMCILGNVYALLLRLIWHFCDFVLFPWVHSSAVVWLLAMFQVSFMICKKKKHGYLACKKESNATLLEIQFKATIS